MTTAATVLDANAIYSLGHSTEESARLQRQAEEWLPESRALLGGIDLAPGATAIDLGCGPRGVVDLLAEAVGPDGRVVGLDSDPAHVAMTAAFAATRGLIQVEAMTGDAVDTHLPADSFDLVHARALLVNVPTRPAWSLRWRVWPVLVGGSSAWSRSRPSRSASPRRPRSSVCTSCSSRPSGATVPTPEPAARARPVSGRRPGRHSGRSSGDDLPGRSQPPLVVAGPGPHRKAADPRSGPVYRRRARRPRCPGAHPRGRPGDLRDAASEHSGSRP